VDFIVVLIFARFRANFRNGDRLPVLIIVDWLRTLFDRRRVIFKLLLKNYLFLNRLTLETLLGVFGVFGVIAQVVFIIDLGFV
jgi:hypothetical protein